MEVVVAAGIKVRGPAESDESFGHNCWAICMASCYVSIWGCHGFPHHTVVCMCAQSLSHVWLFVFPWTAAHQAPIVCGNFQAGILEWVAVSFSKGSS